MDQALIVPIILMSLCVLVMIFDKEIKDFIYKL